MEAAETDTIYDLEGTEITTDVKTHPPLPSVTWHSKSKTRANQAIPKKVSQRLEVRDAIRKEFRRVYKQLMSYGIQPVPTAARKLIYDESTENMHISGFRMGGPMDNNDKWSDVNYFLYGLANPSSKMDWNLDSSEWEF
ncbi:hypothetical protein CBS147333_3280 [Penicillium roqueforti]|nr:hypothetical protein CBS147354_9006 [Penicillium roqueforti]KAI2732964.1 hypothetical protein DTO013F2_10485 [Penicillium roqueforti]KAI3112772.1 hypothetical protein CBS147333_3280 [Penicillium roqueforti]KAI3129726.1 hypothetical protein CBS147326_6175 [Penicillium roqueforti]KAI3195003.1 hypothetical protein CBS147311_8313 [Penicillium roqueforti]